MNFIDELFVKNGERLTCAGHLSIVDMLLSYVSGALGAEFGEAVASEMIAAGPRPPHTSQHRRSDMSNRVEENVSSLPSQS